MEYNITDEELTFAEDVAFDSALRFMTGWQDWNEDEVLPFACDYHGFDQDFVWLATRVLFAPAVWNVATGQTM